MKFITGLTCVFFSSFFLSSGIQADDLKRIDLSDDGKVLIYRKPVDWIEKAVAIGTFPVAVLCAYFGYNTRDGGRNDFPLYMYGTSAVCALLGLYGVYKLNDKHSKMNEPLIVLSQEGIWHELHGFTSWRDVAGFTTCAVHQDRNRVEEFIEFERFDGTRFEVNLIAPGIWDPVIGVSKYQFIKAVRKFYND